MRCGDPSLLPREVEDALQRWLRRGQGETVWGLVQFLKQHVTAKNAPTVITR